MTMNIDIIKKAVAQLSKIKENIDVIPEGDKQIDSFFIAVTEAVDLGLSCLGLNNPDDIEESYEIDPTELQEVMFTLKDLEGNRALIKNPDGEFPQEYEEVGELLDDQFEKLERIELQIKQQ